MKKKPSSRPRLRSPTLLLLTPTCRHICVQTYIYATYSHEHPFRHINLHTQIRGSLNKFPDFFVWALLFIVHTWNWSPLPSNLLRLQWTCCTLPTTSGRPHGSPLMWTCQWPSSQPLSSPQLNHNDSLWA